jgi:ubiquinone/menaquinone biosynthesis C-methylase UbiE
MSGRVSAASLGVVIEELVRHPGGGPAPRGLPCFGLESTSGTGSHLLDALAAHGIFRKYETVLDLAGGIGGTGRWLAARLGCAAVVTADAGATAVAGRRLTRLTRLRGQVAHVTAQPAALPFGAACFTHVWAIEVLVDLPDVAGALVEAFRVLRPGGHLAVQELASSGDNGMVSRAGRRFVPASAWREALAAAGFVDIVVRETAHVAEHSAQVAAARQRLADRLAASPDGEAEAGARHRVGDALARGRLRVAQLLARRP